MKHLIAFLAWALPTASVDAIVAGLIKFVAKLEAAELAHAKIAADASNEMARLLELHAKATDEAARARRVRERISALVG